MPYKSITADPDYFPCRDPADTYAAKEAKTCAGCVRIKTVRAFGSLHQVCKVRPGHPLDKKCRLYLPDERAE